MFRKCAPPAAADLGACVQMHDPHARACLVGTWRQSLCAMVHSESAHKPQSSVLPSAHLTASLVRLDHRYKHACVHPTTPLPPTPADTMSTPTDHDTSNSNAVAPLLSTVPATAVASSSVAVSHGSAAPAAARDEIVIEQPAAASSSSATAVARARMPKWSSTAMRPARKEIYIAVAEEHHFLVCCRWASFTCSLC